MHRERSPLDLPLITYDAIVHWTPYLPPPPTWDKLPTLIASGQWPPGCPNSFDFMQFSGKFGKIICWPPPGSWCPPRDILDLPLVMVTWGSSSHLWTESRGLQGRSLAWSSNVFTSGGLDPFPTSSDISCWSLKHVPLANGTGGMYPT